MIYNPVDSINFLRRLPLEYINLSDCGKLLAYVYCRLRSQAMQFSRDISIEDMKQMTLDHRSRLVNAYRFRCTQSASHCAMDLTLHAIERGFVADRKIVKGNTLISWCKKGDAALWAINSACELLFDLDYVPETFEEYVAFIFIYLDSHSSEVDSVDAAMSVFPASFDRDVVRFIVGHYFSA